VIIAAIYEESHMIIKTKKYYSGFFWRLLRSAWRIW